MFSTCVVLLPLFGCPIWFTKVDNYFVAAGMGSEGITAGPAVGRFLSEWLVNKESSVHLWAHDVSRFVDMHNNRKFLRERVSETVGGYACVYLHFFLPKFMF